MEENHSRLIKFAIWLSKTRFGKYIFGYPKCTRITVLIFVIFTHSLYWLTSWWSPFPYIIFMLLGLWFGQGILKPWATIVSQSIQPQWDSAMLKISIPFVVLNYVAIFACLYMFGSVVDCDGNSINGMWQHFYFSAVTLTTLGYGNLIPKGTFTEIVATIEALVGFMGFAVLAGVVASIVLKRAEMSDKA